MWARYNAVLAHAATVAKAEARRPDAPRAAAAAAAGELPKAEARRPSPPTAPPEPAAPAAVPTTSGAAAVSAPPTLERDDAAAAPAPPRGLSEAEVEAQAAAEGLTLARSTANASGFKGVCLAKPGRPRPYQAQAWRGNRYQSLGHFVTAAEAALAYARVKSLGDGDDGKEEAKEEVKEEEGEAAPAIRRCARARQAERIRATTGGGGGEPPRPPPPSNGCPACAGKHRAHTCGAGNGGRGRGGYHAMKSLARTARMPSGGRGGGGGGGGGGGRVAAPRWRVEAPEARRYKTTSGARAERLAERVGEPLALPMPA